MPEIQVTGITIEADSVVIKGSDFDELCAAARECGRLTQELSLAEEGLANYAQENERLQSILAQRLQELDDAKWLIRNGEKHFGSLWRDATAADIMAVTRRPAVPQSEPTK